MPNHYGGNEPDPFSGGRMPDAFGASRLAHAADQSKMTEAVNESFFTNFHKNVLRRGLEKREGGDVTTMRIASVGLGDKTYLIPLFDPEVGEVVPLPRAIQNAMPFIRSGQLQGYGSVDEAEASRRRFYGRIVNNFDPSAAGFRDLINPTDTAFNRVVGGLTR